MIADRLHAGADEDGVAVVEFAIIFLLFMLLLWGLITFGVIFGAQQSITHAAAEAARSVVNIGDYNADGNIDEDDARDRIDDVVAEQLAWLDDDGEVSDLTWDVTFPSCGDGTPTPTCVRVEVAYDWGSFPIVPVLLDIATPDTLSSVASVQIQ